MKVVASIIKIMSDAAFRDSQFKECRKIPTIIGKQFFHVRQRKLLWMMHRGRRNIFFQKISLYCGSVLTDENFLHIICELFLAVMFLHWNDQNVYFKVYKLYILCSTFFKIVITSKTRNENIWRVQCNLNIISKLNAVIIFFYSKKRSFTHTFNFYIKM